MAGGGTFCYCMDDGKRNAVTNACLQGSLFVNVIPYNERCLASDQLIPGQLGWSSFVGFLPDLGMAIHHFKHSAFKKKRGANGVYGFKESPYIHNFLSEVAATDAHKKPVASIGALRYHIALSQGYAMTHADNGSAWLYLSVMAKVYD